MVLINTKTNEAYSNVWIAEAARRIGINQRTVSRWIRKGKTCEVFNHWILYINETKLKKKTGFALR